ncbi:ABC transporter permease [Lapillicoccus sp.]|uniref:ABC transporter permease n=1 Tax=Lapillicoccus sp. TaxID=1909287 RepID=UPI0039834D0E
MLIYIARRLALAASVVLVTLVATFVLFYAGPADPAQSLCGELRCDQAKLVEIRKSLHLDRPIAVQFSEYFTGLFVGRDVIDGGTTKRCTAPCLGYSFRSHRDVKTEVFSRFPTTAALALMSMVVFLSIGITTGVYAARRRGTKTDRTVVGVSQVVGAIPFYIVALLFALYLTRLNSILPRAAAFSDGIGPWLVGMIAPAIILGLVYATTYVRYTRAQMVDTLSQDYVRTARSKGISTTTVTYKHALRGALSPVLTILGLDMAGLLSGTLITESIFELDGMGRLAIVSLGQDDLPIIMGTVLMSAVIVVLMNLLVDVLYSAIDPRVRLA